MRAVWSDQARVQRYLDVGKALSLVEGRLGVIPSNAAEEIGRHYNVSEMDFERMKSAMEHIGYPVLLLFRRGEVERLRHRCVCSSPPSWRSSNNRTEASIESWLVSESDFQGDCQ